MYLTDRSIFPYIPVETKADPFSLESLIAWLEKQDAGALYCYSATGHCLLAQYGQAHDIWRSVGSLTFTTKNGEEGDLPETFDDISFGLPRTFGAALDRARAIRSANSLSRAIMGEG